MVTSFALTRYVAVSVVLGATATEQSAPVLTRAPELFEHVEAQYPAEAQARRVEGAVEMLVDLNATGRVVEVQVVTSPDASLARAAIDAVLAMRFSPAEVNGEPAAVRIGYTYHFKLHLEPNPDSKEPEQTPPAPAVLAGTVVAADGSPVAAALVEVEPGGLRAQSDAQGRFAVVLSSSPSDAGTATYLVAASAAGLQSIPLEVSAKEPSDVTLELVSEPLTSDAYETVVRSSRAMRTVSSRRISREELSAVPGTFGDPLRVIEALPGVGRSPFSTGILVIRGSSPDDSRVFIDGHPIPLLYHFGGGPSVIPPEAIDGIEVQTGGFGSRYGRATAGIVEVHTRKGRADTVHGGAHVDLLDAGGSLEGPIGSLGSFRLSARRSYIDTLIPLVRKQAKQGSLTLAPRYYDYHGRADLRVNDDLQLGIAAFGSDDRLNFADERGIRNLPGSLSLHISSHRINPRLSARLGHGFSVSVSPTVGWITTGGETPESHLTLHTFEIGTRAELQIETAHQARVLLGADLTRDAHRFTVRMPGVPETREFPSPNPTTPMIDESDGRLTVQQNGVYGEVEMRAGRLRVVPGLRLHNAAFAGNSHTSAEPRLNLRVRLRDELVAKLGAGVYYRVPDANEIAPRVGNPGLDMERSLQAMLGMEWTFLQIYDLDLQGYIKNMYSLAQGTNELALRDGKLVPLRYASTGQGRAIGAELLLRRQLQRGVMGWIAYSLSRSERRGARDGWHLYVRDQTHNLAAVLSVDIPWGIRLGTRFRYVTGYPVAPVLDADFDADAGRYIPRAGELGSERLPDFIQWDIRVEKAFGDRDGIHVLAYADVQNVTNRRNAEFFQYSHDYSERYAYPGLPLLPAVGVEAKF